jgi:hypothetical protein
LHRPFGGRVGLRRLCRHDRDARRDHPGIEPIGQGRR